MSAMHYPQTRIRFSRQMAGVLTGIDDASRIAADHIRLVREKRASPTAAWRNVRALSRSMQEHRHA